jgi:threonine/homoserine/homoserine lactone efflux protein
MELASFFALLGFVSATTFSPGPNSILITASAAQFGLWRTLPHILGVALGVAGVIFATSYSLGALIQSAPILRSALTLLSGVFLAYLAWRIMATPMPTHRKLHKRPINFSQAILFQIVNPKVWALGLAGTSMFVPAGDLVHATILSLTFACVGLVSNTLWATAGHLLQAVLQKGRRLFWFNIAMAVLLVAAVSPALMHVALPNLF